MIMTTTSIRAARTTEVTRIDEMRRARSPRACPSLYFKTRFLFVAESH
jgi:hypothetical protein